MKNQYFGDINDYRKYGLLRALTSNADGRLLVAWMLTEDDGSRDGDLRDYLRSPEKWKQYDPELYAGLAALVKTGTRPQVSQIEGSSLLPGASFFSEAVPDARANRDLWRTRLLRASEGVDLVFLDPDNGIEVPSKPIGRKDSSKYVRWEEIKAIWDAGSSLLIYQHFCRVPRAVFVERLASGLQQLTGAAMTEAFRTPRVVFFLVAHSRHAVRFGEAIRSFLLRWKGQIDVVGLAIGMIQLTGLAPG